MSGGNFEKKAHCFSKRLVRNKCAVGVKGPRGQQGG